MRKLTFPLAWRLFLDDIASSHYRLLQMTQAIMMVFIITLTLASESVQNHLSLNMANLLGADAVISTFGALPDSHIEQLKAQSNAFIFTQSIKTTLTYKERWQSVTLKAVGNSYPLKGQLQVSDALAQAPYPSLSPPTPGTLWIDSRLASSLGVDVGERLSISRLSLVVSHIVQHEPDRLLEDHNVDMRALLHKDDFNKLGFSDDNIEYRYQMNANDAQLKRIVAYQNSTLLSAQLRHRNGVHPLALFWQRTENFIGLASVLLLFMASIAIFQISRLQIKKEQFFAAVCMSVGASRAQGFYISLVKWVLHLLLLFPVVLIVATWSHWALVSWLSDSLPSLLWKPNIATTVFSFIGCALLVALFQLPVWLSLKHASVRQLVFNLPTKKRSFLGVLCTLVAITFVAFSYSDNGLLTTMVLGSMASCIFLIAIVSWLSLALGEVITKRYSGLIPFTTFMMRKRLVSKSTQIMGVGLCAFLLLFTLMLLRDLGNTMHSYNRQFDGNLVISQANEKQMDSVMQWANAHDAQLRQRKPFVYATLTRINQQRLDDFATRPSESLATFKQAIRLHWTDNLPANNKVISGQWWSDDAQQWQQVSVEQEVLTDLGLNIGDVLTFAIAGRAVEFTIAASHAYIPGAGSMTFWVQMPASAMSHIVAPHYVMASLEVSEANLASLGILYKQHPSLRMISIREMTQRFDDTLALVTKIISGFALIIVCLACIVIVSSVLTYEQRERKKNSVIMSFGLPRRLCLTLNLIEWVITGSIAAFGAMFGTWLAGVLIYQSQFSMTYQPDFGWLATTLCIIVLTVVLIGYLASKRSLSSTIRELLTD
ncbi:ABC transporter permease [Alteromonas sp. KC3]|uniref:ABC transporter permease n=1 Tax=unclassified Alteromonas TaxID=2614992 RepID=UPI001920A9E2|nr:MULTISPECIES: FtsX-like permease family protein [unclassified Alteromonas]BCO19612.1 ABC transporter permease [Alteromonas sp. KC3]BCO23577.1 ABC transporter permease [Alteromonas sp. KC14]